jgi:hypothetical protein
MNNMKGLCGDGIFCYSYHTVLCVVVMFLVDNNVCAILFKNNKEIMSGKPTAFEMKMVVNGWQQLIARLLDSLGHCCTSEVYIK